MYNVHAQKIRRRSIYICRYVYIYDNKLNELNTSGIGVQSYQIYIGTATYPHDTGLGFSEYKIFKK
jgi:hypothetical protein